MSDRDPAELIARHNRREADGGDGALGPWMGIDCEIHPDDDIFRFFYRHPSSVNPIRDYLADGWRTLCELMVLMEWADRPLMQTRSFLEFASGYGRFTRHLVRFLDPAAISVADVAPGSVEFARERFGVQGFYSGRDPASIELPRCYDVVFVLSLFSHLPPATWRAWLERLYRAVSAGGVLVFSTHGAGVARRHGIDLHPDGFHFMASSESASLDAMEYGTMFTTEAFVRDAVAALPEARVEQFRADHFWSGQDAWVVSRRTP